MNWRLAVFLTQRSIRYHRVIALITVAGVALGTCVMASVMVVDDNTARSERQLHERRALRAERRGYPAKFAPLIEKITIVRDARPRRRSIELVPTQRGRAGDQTNGEARLGEEDYQAMRLAVRVASLLAFAIGAIVVFYTMRFAVIARGREFALVQCLGAQRSQVAQLLVLEAAVLGGFGTAIGSAASLPIALFLLANGITTTGRSGVVGFVVPWSELAVFAGIGVLVALAGVVGPVRSLLGAKVQDVLQPRFLVQPDATGRFTPSLEGLSWLLLPLLLASYLIGRPFLRDWLSVVTFFLLESLVAVGFALAVLWWVRPVLRSLIGLSERLLRALYPLESLLTARQMSYRSDRFVFSITSVVLVFSLLTALHTITSALKSEIEGWAQVALYPYTFGDRRSARALDESGVRALAKADLEVFRLSERVGGALPLRLINSADLNRRRVEQGRPPLEPGQVIFSTTLANRFGVEPGDSLEILSDGHSHHFEVVEIDDQYGFYPHPDQYVSLRSFALFTDGNPLFRGNLELTLGENVAVHNRGGGPLRPDQRALLEPFYRWRSGGLGQSRSQQDEIDRDFLIFDYVLGMTVLLASVGIVNAMLIQVRARSREFALYRVVGMSAGQVTRLLLIEGAITGLVGGVLALVLGVPLGMISVSFLDRFTLFDLEYAASLSTMVLVFLGAVAVCCVSAIYPAVKATQISSAESLHYE